MRACFWTAGSGCYPRISLAAGDVSLEVMCSYFRGLTVVVSHTVDTTNPA